MVAAAQGECIDRDIAELPDELRDGSWAWATVAGDRPGPGGPVSGLPAMGPGPAEPGLSDVHNSPRVDLGPVDARWVPRLRMSVGGAVFTIKLGGPASRVGLDRGAIWEFSRQSRRRLQTFLASVPQAEVEPQRLWFVTLTYPGEFTRDPKAWKADLQAFQKRLQRAFGRLGIIWKLEAQRRGAPHYHLIVLVPPEWVVGLECDGQDRLQGRLRYRWRGGKLAEFRTWCATAWYEVVGSGDERHRMAGTQVDPVKSWAMAGGYCGKYLGKVGGFVSPEGEIQLVGRYWGVWNRELFNVSWRTVAVPMQCVHRAMRVLRRLVPGVDLKCAKSVTLILQPETVAKLMAYAADGWERLDYLGMMMAAAASNREKALPDPVDAVAPWE